MNNESYEIWEAVKETKYRDTVEKLRREFNNATELDDVLDSILKNIVEASHAEAGSLWFYDYYGTGKIKPRVVYGGGDIGNITLNLGEGIVGSVIKDNKGVIISDCQKDERFSKKADRNSGFVTKSMICIPIGNETAFASIQIINKKDGTLFDNKDFDFTSTLSKEASDLFSKMSSEFLFGNSREGLLKELESLIHNNSKEDILKSLQEDLNNKEYNPKASKKILKYTDKLLDYLINK